MNACQLLMNVPKNWHLKLWHMVLVVHCASLTKWHNLKILSAKECLQLTFICRTCYPARGCCGGNFCFSKHYLKA